MRGKPALFVISSKIRARIRFSAEVRMTVVDKLKNLSEQSLAEFMARLVPTMPRERVAGVRVPAIRRLAKSLDDAEREDFLNALPHFYLEENILHSVLVSGMKDFDATVEAVREFLPHIDNWAVCDALSPRSFARADVRDRVRELAFGWLASERVYTARFGANCMRSFMLGEGFDKSVADAVARVGGEYYLDMGAAWFFCEAIVKRPDEVLPYFEEGRLSVEVHRLAVKKCVESFRVTSELKEHLRALPLPESTGE